MTDLAQRGPLGLKRPKEPKRTHMRNTAKGKRPSSDCPFMRSAKGEPCLADWCQCGGSTETTALRHIRIAGIGGMAMKPVNYIGFYGCAKAERMFEVDRAGFTWHGVLVAWVLTIQKMRAKGLLE